MFVGVLIYVIGTPIDLDCRCLVDVRSGTVASFDPLIFESTLNMGFIDFI